MNEIENQSQTIPSHQAGSSAQLNETAENDENDETLFSKSTDSLMSTSKTKWSKIHLEANVTLAQLVDLKEQLSQYQGGKVQLYGTKVGWIDTAGLQLLLAFKDSSDTTVEWIEPSTALYSTAKMIGLSSQLGLPES